MSIDLTREPAIRFADVSKLPWLPQRRRGQRLHVATVFRWAQRGIHGHRLEYVQLGGCKVTTEAALRRFFERLTHHAQADRNAPMQGGSLSKRDEAALDAARL
jgi:Protein of unknown function (DUF1580)